MCKTASTPTTAKGPDVASTTTTTPRAPRREPVPSLKRRQQFRRMAVQDVAARLRRLEATLDILNTERALWWDIIEHLEAYATGPQRHEVVNCACQRSIRVNEEAMKLFDAGKRLGAKAKL